MEDYENHKNIFFNPKVYFFKKRHCEISSESWVYYFERLSSATSWRCSAKGFLL
ncbi:hypothetical protein ACRRTK_000402 [Alexandromys fortis]